MLNMKKKLFMMRSKYKQYGSIYTEYCLQCVREGTAYCRYEFEDNKCINFKSLDDMKKEYSV